jgi:hypothetical protein
VHHGLAGDEQLLGAPQLIGNQAEQAGLDTTRDAIKALRPAQPLLQKALVMAAASGAEALERHRLKLHASCWKYELAAAGIMAVGCSD